MKKHISIIALIIGGLSSISLTNTLEYKLKIYGDWEFEKVKIEGVEKSVSDLNNCGYNDVLQIRRKKEKVIYEFDKIKISGNRIGISNLKICSLSPIVYKYEITNNSCPTEWIKIENSKNRIISINEGLVVEYKIKKPNRKKMILTIVREIANYGNQIPDEIHLKKIKKRKLSTIE